MLFRRKPTPTESPKAPDDGVTLTRRIDDVERAVRMLALEWSDTLDRLNRLASRIAKRQEREREAYDEPAGYTNGAGDAMNEVEKRRNRAWPGGGRT